MTFRINLLLKMINPYPSTLVNDVS